MDEINNIKSFHLRNKILSEGVNLLENGDYIISGNLTIEVNAVLNIKNARLMFESDSGIICKGKITANTTVFMAAPNFKTWNNVKLSGPGTNESIFNNCIFENGRGTLIDEKTHGSAIFIENTGSSKITFTNCTFKNSRAFLGGAIYCERSNPIIEKSLFENLIGENSGGAIALTYNSCPQILWCTFRKNGAGGGGAIYCYDNSDAKITDCSFEECQADTGGAIYTRFSTHEIENCIFTKCLVIQKNAAGGGCAIYKSSVTIKKCKFNGCRAKIGGGIEVKGGILSINYSDLNDCVANPGSAIALSKDAEAKIFKSNFTKCNNNMENEDHTVIFADLSAVRILESCFFTINECQISDLIKITSGSPVDLTCNDCKVKKLEQNPDKADIPQNILKQDKKAFQSNTKAPPAADTSSNIGAPKPASASSGQIPIIDSSQYPEKIKIETAAGFEQSLDALACCGIVFGGLLLIGVNPSNSRYSRYNSHRHEIDPVKHDYAGSFITGIGLLTIGGLCLLLRYSIHSYYVIDRKNKIITFNYIVNKFKQESVFLKFDEIAGVALNSIPQLIKGKTIYNHRNAIITKAGKVINFNIAGDSTGFIKIEFLENFLKPEIPYYQTIFNSSKMNYFNLEEQAKVMAALFNCPYYKVPDGQAIGIKKENVKCKIYFKQASSITWNNIVMFTALFLILLLLVFYIIKITQ
ncbi:MAG: right-handed parallel beta-helix repeat-containing protein [Candidatus Wallbacteria bacterium]